MVEWTPPPWNPKHWEWLQEILIGLNLDPGSRASVLQICGLGSSARRLANPNLLSVDFGVQMIATLRAVRGDIMPRVARLCELLPGYLAEDDQLREDLAQLQVAATQMGEAQGELTRLLEERCPTEQDVLRLWQDDLRQRRTDIANRRGRTGSCHAAVADLLLADEGLLERVHDMLCPVRHTGSLVPIPQGVHLADNPYLLGGPLLGRGSDLAAMTDWLLMPNESGEGHRVFCITELGGTGKSALAAYWLKTAIDTGLLEQNRYSSFWSTFYARDYDWTVFLESLATGLNVATTDPQVQDRAEPNSRFMVLKDLILQELRRQKWVVVLDGLEREMGAFANPDNFLLDSEEQDRLNEGGDLLPDDVRIRSVVFHQFICELLTTQAKVVITSRHVPEDLMKDGRPMSEVTEHPLPPLSRTAAAELWELSSRAQARPEDLDMFLVAVDYHPQVVTVVSAAVAHSQGQNFREWLRELQVDNTAPCFKHQSLTARRHYWLDLGMRDLPRDHRKAWIALCCGVSRPGANMIANLAQVLVTGGPQAGAQERLLPSNSELLVQLAYLEERHLIGIDADSGKFDVHPLIRTQVTKHIRGQMQLRPEQADGELLRLVTCDGATNDAFLKATTRSDLEASLRLLLDVGLEQASQQLGYRGVLKYLARFYPDSDGSISAWSAALPALATRRDQAWCLLQTAECFMVLGRWAASSRLFARAEFAYGLSNDQESVQKCRRAHDWQALYGASLYECESHKLDHLLGPAPMDTDPYWLALLLAIRQSDHAYHLLLGLPHDRNRWTLQTIAEAWYYLGEYGCASELAESALRRDTERASPAQVLWERVTLGLASLRIGRLSCAREHLISAASEGIGIGYGLIPRFAYAGMVELLYREALRLEDSKRVERLVEAEKMHERYCNADPENRFQIPAAEAHLAMARVQCELGQAARAREWAHEALKVARGSQPPFCYRAVERGAMEFLSRDQAPYDLRQPDAHRVLCHEQRIAEWVRSREGVWADG
jgi:hypothetical protein